MRSILFCILVGTGIISLISILFVFSHDTVQNKNNFHRSFLKKSSLEGKFSLDLKYKSYYIAGTAGNRIYLGNFNQPNHMVVTNYSLTDSQHVYLNIPHNKKRLAWKSLKTYVDSKGLFVTEGITPTILHSDNSTFQYEKLNTTVQFFDFIALTRSSFAFRSYDNNLHQSVLIRETMTYKSSEKVSFPLEKQIDGYFCTDGMLLYNQDLKQIIYVYFYRNQFIGLDTNLTILYKGNTIDTTRHAKIKIGKISSQNKTVLIGSPPVINHHTCTFKSFLFIHSVLIASNENKDSFEGNSVIDVYSLKDQQYIFSFYLPLINGRKLRQFIVFENNIVTLHDQFITLYDLPKEISENKI